MGKEEKLKKVLCLLVIFLSASFSFGTVIISCQDLGNHIVQLSYDASSESSLVRAFALNIYASDGVFLAIGNYHTGESTASNPGYGIYPATINIGPDGTVIDFGDPLADPMDPGSSGGIGTNGITLEFGSGYYDDENAPLASGVLCTFTVSEDCTISLAEEDTYRGGVVLEDGTQVQAVCYGCEVIPEPATICLIGMGSALLRRKRM